MSKRSYTDSVHFSGRIWSVIALVVFLAVPVTVSLSYGFPEWGVVGKGVLGLIIFPLTGIIEVVTYSPLLGPGATYLAFITGNITNLKLPCALNAMENAKVEASSEEADIVKTISIASSAIVTTIIIAVLVLAFAFNPAFSNLMNSETFKPAFEQVSFTVFGALAASYFIKHWKISILPIALCALILFLVPGFDFTILMFIGIIIAIAGAFAMYKLKWV